MVKKIIHNQIPVPDFFDTFGDFLTGEITISRNFEDHPTCQVQLVVGKNDIEAIRERFKGTNKDRFDIYSIPFRLRSYTEEENTQQVYPEGLYNITLSFEGWWRLLVETPVHLRKKNPNIRDATGTLTGSVGGDPFDAPQCQISSNNSAGSGSTVLFNTAETLNVSDGSDPLKPKVSRTTLGQIAERANVTLKGGEGLTLEFPSDTSYNTYVTLAQGIQSKFITEGLIVKYSKSEVQGIKWEDGKSHTLTPDEIIGAVTHSVNSEPVAYKNTELVWDKFGKDPLDVDQDDFNRDFDERNQVNQRPQFEAQRPVTYTVTSGDNLPEEPPLGLTTVNSVTLNWDVSGPTKVEKITTFQGDAIMEETENTYGFAFSAVDLSVVGGGKLNASPVAQWKLVRTLKTVYNYDGSTGYLLGSDANGWMLARFKVEQFWDSADDPRRGKYPYDTQYWRSLAASDPLANAKEEAFKFRRVPIKGITRYELHAYSDYYNDPANLLDQIILYEYCGRNGKLARGYVWDKTYVPPMFIKRSVEFFGAYAMQPNPWAAELTAQEISDGGGEPEYLTLGQERFFRENVQVYQSANTKTSFDLIGQSNSDGPDRYRKFVVDYDASDYSFGNNANSTRIEEYNGRPPQATFIPPPYRLASVDVSDNNRPPVQNLARRRNQRRLQQLDKLKKRKYLLTSENAECVRGGGSINIDTDDIKVAAQAAVILLNIQNFRQREITTLPTFFNPQIDEGDFIEYTFNDQSYRKRVVRSTSVIRILGKTTENELVITGATTLTLGLDSKITVEGGNEGSTSKVDIYDENGLIVDGDVPISGIIRGTSGNKRQVNNRFQPFLDVSLPPQRRGFILGEFDAALFQSGRGTDSG